MVFDVISNKILYPVVTELFIRDRALNILLIFIRKSYFMVQSDLKLITTPFSIMMIPNYKSFHKLSLMIHLALKSINVRGFTVFWPLVLLFYQILFYVLKRKLEIKICNMKLTEQQQRYLHYHQVKWINIIIWQVKKYCHNNKQRRITEQPKFSYLLLPNGDTTSNRRHFHMDITSIRRRPNFEEFPGHFHAFFRCNFADSKIHVVSTYFFVWNFDDPKIHVVSTYFFGRNFDG